MSRRFKRILLALIVVGYIATWVFGVPAAQSVIAEDVIARYKQRAAKVDPEFRGGYPGIRCKAAIPVLPFLVAVRHEYVIGPLYAWSGIEFFLWFPWHTESIGQLTFWVS